MTLLYLRLVTSPLGGEKIMNPNTQRTELLALSLRENKSEVKGKKIHRSFEPYLETSRLSTAIPP